MATRFLRQAEAAPYDIALADDQGIWAYRCLTEQAATLARQLRGAGAEEGTLIALSVSRGWRVVTGILAIWMNECAYVAIDPDYPAMRRDFIRSDARISHLVTDGPHGGMSVTRIGTSQPPHVLPADAAYVLYTSGSTGRPKGTIVTHTNVSSLLDSAAKVLPVRQGDIGTIFHSYCFDFSVWETWRMLTAGGHCVYVPAKASFDARLLIRLLAEREITVLNLVPSVFANLVRVLQRQPVPLPRLREIIFGGEPLNVKAVIAWRQLGLAPQAELINMYGITETTVHVTAKRLDYQEISTYQGTETPIGRPLPHLQVSLLDEGRQPVAPGETGEIYVTGLGVSAGYLGQPELTAERFVRLHIGKPGHLWYRTGDLAYFDGQGELTFIGRKDSQVQLHGYRIELGEIDSALRCLAGVEDAAAVVVSNASGHPTLMACYVPANGTELDLTELRSALRARLPRYMIPARLISIPELPVTPEGKLDRTVIADTLSKPWDS